jgi:hypothetical protein
VTRPWRDRQRLTVAGETLDLMVAFQVPGDGLRSGVQALPGQLLAQPDDELGSAGLVADGEVLGRRDRGSNAASPSAS